MKNYNEKKKEGKKQLLEPCTEFLRDPSQDLRVPFYETLPVGYFRCVVL